jgi:purine nucleosidase
MIKEPMIIPRIREIALMGGAIELGNVTPAAEFNIYVDPHAASVVFESGAPITMFGLDVTHKALVTEKRLAHIRAIGTPVAEACAGLLDFFNRYDRDRYHTPGAPLHDPCVIAWLLRPGLFSGKHCRVEVETEGSRAIGRTLVDWWHRIDQPERPKNALVINEIDADGFFALLTERLARL